MCRTQDCSRVWRVGVGVVVGVRVGVVECQLKSLLIVKVRFQNKPVAKLDSDKHRYHYHFRRFGLKISKY